MKLRISTSIIIALLAPALYAQALPETQSGPFWRHVAKFATLGQGCTLTVNGQPFAINLIIPADRAPNALIKIHVDCSNGGATQMLDATLTPTMPPEMPPIAARSGFFWQLPPGSLPTSMVVDATLTPGASRNSGSTYDFNVEGTYGTAVACDTKTDTKKAQPKGAIKATLPFTCDNQKIDDTFISQGHGFADGTDIAQIETRFTMRGFENPPGGGSIQESYLELDISSQYKMAPPKIQLSPDKVQISGTKGLANGGSATISATNIGGGLLDFALSNNNVVVPSAGNPGGGSARIIGSPTQITGVKPQESTTFTVTVDTTSVVADGTFTGTLPINSQHASNLRSTLSLPVTLVTGSASCPASAQTKDPRAGDSSQCTDSITMQNLAPPPSQPLLPNSDQLFSAQANVTLASKDQADARLELTDAGGTTSLASSAPVRITSRGSSTANLTLSTKIPATGSQVILHATLRDTGGALLKEDTAAYNISSGDSTIQITSSSPSPGEVIFANAEDKTPAFSATVKYSLNSGPTGMIVLQVSDQAGKVLGLGPPVSASQGDHTAGLSAPAASYNSDTTTSVSLVALLEDGSGKILARSNEIPYPITLPKITLTLGSLPSTGLFTAAPADTVLEGGSQIEYSVDNAAIQASYDYPGSSAHLSILIQTDQQWIGRTPPQSIAKGAGTASFQIGSMKVPTKGTAVVFAAILETSTGQKYRIPPIVVPMETITRGPATPPENSEILLTRDPSNPTFTLPVQFSFPVSYQIGPAGAILMKTILTDRGEFGDKETLPAGSGQTTVSFSLPLYTSQDRSRYSIMNADTTRPDGKCPCAHADKAEWNKFKATFTLLPGATTNFVPVVGGSVSPTQNTTTRNVTSSTSGTDLSPQPATSGGQSNSLQLAARAAAASSAIPDFIGVHRTWQFTPPIPSDGSFAASLTLNYSAAALPDDPNFDETKLRIVSYNPATGAFTTYETAIDLTNKAATAQVNSLEPMYSLAVLGPFSKAMLNAPPYAIGDGFDTKAWLVNMGNADAHLNVNGYSLDGTTLSPNPIPATLAPNKQLMTSVASLGFSTTGIGRTGWVQAAVDSATVSGVVTIGDGTLLDGLPLSTGHSSSSVLTDIEFDDTYSTEIRVVNPATNSRNFTIDLRGSDGNSAGAYAGRLGAKDTLVSRVEDLFPSIQKPFNGYAVVSGDGDVLASALLFSYSNLTALSGHPLDPRAAGGLTLYGPQLGAPGQFTRVILVNAGGVSANLTLTAYKADGSPAGSLVNRKLASGEQWIADLAQLLGFDAANPLRGSFTVTSDQPSVFGDLVFGDASPQRLTRASIPLAAVAAKSALLFVENDATLAASVNIANPNSAPAAVTAIVFNTDGTQIGRGVVSVPANGFSSTSLIALVPAAANLAAGYLTLGSTQPVVSFGLLAPVSGADFVAFPAQPIASASTGGTPVAPQITVTPSSFDFGSVPIRQPKSQKFTIGNTGQADLRVNSIRLSGDPSFSLVPAFAPVTLAAGKSTDVTVQFSPAAVGAVSGSLSIASDDPDPTRNPLTVILSGTANPAATGGLSVTPTSLVFDSVTVGTSQTKAVTITNNGNAALNVTALTAAAPFSVVSPAPPISVPAGASSTVTVKFAPTVAGTQSGALSIASNDAAMPSVIVNLTGSGVTGGGTPNIIRTLGYHEITRFPKEVRFSNGGMPVLSAGGGRAVYAHAPGDETDARYNHIFVVNADGSGQREVDVYKQNCSCGAIVDISADGNTVVSTDGVELRAASATGSAGKRLIANREIPYVRISPKGDKVFFIHRRGDASASDPATERGLYVINADGSGLKQIAGPKAVAPLLGTTADKVFPFATNGWSLDVSVDGTKLVFGVAAPGGERIFAVNADGTGLRQALGPVDFVNHVALSGDGTKVGYDVIPPPCCSTPNEVGVVNADGSNRKSLATKTPDIGSANRIQMSGDGTQLLYGGTSYLYASDASGVVQLSARGGYYSSDSAPLVTDGFGQPTMNSVATRFLYVVRDAAGIAQLAILDLNPPVLGDAPSITAASLTQPSIALSGANQSLVSAMIATSNTINRVSAAVLSAGITDPNVAAPVMLDDGTNGDQVAGDGIYTGRISANCCAAPGPKNVRVKAEVRDSGNRRHATAIEFGGLTVVSNTP